MKQIFLFFLMQRYNFFRHPAILFLHFLLNTSLLLIYIKSTTMFTIKNMRHITLSYNFLFLSLFRKTSTR